MPTKQKSSLKTPFKEYLIAKIDDYMDQAFAVSGKSQVPTN